MNLRFAGVDHRIGWLDRRLSGVEHEIGKIKQKLGFRVNIWVTVVMAVLGFLASHVS